MKLINLFGDTIAEKLRKLEISVNDLFSEMAALGWYVTKQSYVDENQKYNASFITSPEVTASFIGRPIYFAGSGILAVVSTYNENTGEFTVEDAYNIKGEPGVNGANGTNGTNGLDGKNGFPNAFVQINPPNRWTITRYKNSEPEVGKYYVVYIINSANSNYRKGDIVVGIVTEFENNIVTFRPDTITVITNIVGAQGVQGEQGRGITSVQAISHREENNETITTCQAVFNSGTPSEFEVHAKNGSGGTKLYKHVIQFSESSNWFINIISNMENVYSDLDEICNDIVTWGGEYDAPSVHRRRILSATKIDDGIKIAVESGQNLDAPTFIFIEKYIVSGIFDLKTPL